MNELTGRYVRAIRELHGLTLDEMAEIVGISRMKLARIETGTSKMTDEIADRFCAELHINPARVAGAGAGADGVS